jgi:hypothetical protein
MGREGREQVLTKAQEAGGPAEAYLKTPVGLRNLGATCYLNVLLQALFFNRRFRQAVYEFRPPSGPRPGEEGGRKERMVLILQELQRLFAHMQLGMAREGDPREFVRLLRLDRGQQQDPQEFRRLFLGKIEECFGALSPSSPPSSPSPDLASMVRSLHRGRLLYLTTCLSCGTASRREGPFDELELSLLPSPSSPATVAAGVARYLAPERLEGENRYLCGRCGEKREAERRVILTALPPLLTVQLLRYVYVGGEKRKVKQVVALDETLDLGLVARGGADGGSGGGGGSSLAGEAGAPGTCGSLSLPALSLLPSYLSSSTLLLCDALDALPFTNPLLPFASFLPPYLQGCTIWWASCSTRAARLRTVITRRNSGRCRRGDGGTWMTRRSGKADMRRC